MESKGLVVLLATACFALSSSLSHADIVFQLSDQNSCNNLPGTWAGYGTVIALNGIVNCKYTGTAWIAGFSDPHSFIMQVKLNIKTGVCPPREDLNLSGSCDKGVIILKTDPAHLSGHLNADGTVAEMGGTVTINIPKMGDVKADIKDMNMHKTFV